MRTWAEVERPCKHGTEGAGDDYSVCSACVHERGCEHDTWATYGLVLGGILVIGLLLAGTCGLTVGVFVRAYSFAAGEP